MGEWLKAFHDSMIVMANMPEFASPEQWPFLPILERFGVAISIGLFVGIEREYSGKLGTRTFGLVAILGCLAGVAGVQFIWISAPIFLLVLTLINWRRVWHTISSQRQRH